MTEFEKWWEEYQDRGVLSPTRGNRYLVEQAWHAAQRALLRTIANPPCIPEAGDRVKFLGLCHPKSLGQVKEVTKVTKESIPVYWVETKTVKDGEETFSSGILSEVEKIDV